MRVTQVLEQANPKKIDEAPVGAIKQGLRKLGAKAAAKVGMKGTAMGLAGKVDAGTKANELMNSFKGYLGRTGGDMNKTDAATVKAFLQSQKMPTNSVPASGIVPKKQIDQIFLKSAQDSFKLSGDAPTADAAKGGTGSTDANKDGKDDATGKPMPVDANKDGKDDNTGEPIAKDDNAGGGQKIEFTPEQPVLFPDKKTGQLKPATVVGKSEDGDENKVSIKGSKGQKFNIPRTSLVDPETKKPFTPGAAKGQAGGNVVQMIPKDIKQKLDQLTPDQKKELIGML